MPVDGRGGHGASGGAAYEPPAAVRTPRGAAVGVRVGLRYHLCVAVFGIGGVVRSTSGEQFLRAAQPGVDVGRGEQPVVEDLEELARQDVEQKVVAGPGASRTREASECRAKTDHARVDGRRSAGGRCP